MASLKDIENKVTNIEKRILSTENEYIAEQVAKIATQDKERYLKKQKTMQILIICLTIVLSVLILCSSFIALNSVYRYFDYQESLVIEKETVEEVVEEYTYEAEAGDNGIANAGDNNSYMIGGDE